MRWCWLFVIFATCGDDTKQGDTGDECKSEELSCDGVCIDPTFDLDNCGACGNVCSENSICDQRACVCKEGFDDCGEGDAVVCVDKDTDDDHCGTCGNTCGLGHRCEGGECVLQCDRAGETPCGETCVDLSVSDQNCGACGNDCGSNGNCIASHCYCAGDFTVEDMTPKRNTIAPLDSSITLTMTCQLGADQDAAPLFVYGSRSGAVSGTTTYDKFKVTFTPSEPLRSGDRVSVSLAAGRVTGPEDEPNVGWVGQFEGRTTAGYGHFEQVMVFDAEADEETRDLLDGNPLRNPMAIDIDNDGDDDIWVSRPGDLNSIALLLENDGTGKFTFHSHVVFGGDWFGDPRYESGRRIAIDVDDDGFVDDVVDGQEAAVVWTGKGDFTFEQARGVGSSSLRDPLAGDLDRDGDLDLLFNGSKVNITMNDGSGKFPTLHDFTFAGGSQCGQIGDVDGDGDLDFMGESAGVWLNDGLGYFTQQTGESVPGGTIDLALRDFDGDGLLDNVRSGGVWLGLGDGTFLRGDDIPAPATSWEEPSAFDVDGDGDLDVLWPNGDVLVNDGEAHFTKGVSLGFSDTTVSIGDYDGDGALDFATAIDGQVYVYFNRPAAEP